MEPEEPKESSELDERAGDEHEHEHEHEQRATSNEHCCDGTFSPHSSTFRPQSARFNATRAYLSLTITPTLHLQWQFAFAALQVSPLALLRRRAAPWLPLTLTSAALDSNFNQTLRPAP